MEQDKYEYDVFISYSRKDLFDEQSKVISGNKISKIIKQLDDANISYWYDNKGYSGESVTTTITQKIKASRIFLFISSNNSNNNSAWTPKEVSVAIQLKKFIIPVKIDSSNYSDSFLMHLTDIRSILYSDNSEQSRAELIEAIQKKLKDIDQESHIAEIKKLKEDNTELKSIIKKNEKDINNLNKDIRKKSNTITSTAILASLLTLGLLYCLAFPRKTTKPMLLFSGGGSVVNYIDSVYQKNLKKYPNSVYVNQASANAWTLLVEDAFIDGEKPFFPICLSADTIDTKYINAKYSSKANPGYIIGIKLGEDPLVVYIDTITAKKWGYTVGEDSKIMAQKLSEEINNINQINKKKRELIIFTTSSNSGTLRAYQNSFKKYHNIHFDEMIDDTLSYLFFDECSVAYYNDVKSGLPYIALGSESYKPDSLRKEHYTRLFVENENGRIKKPIYVYFRVNNHVKNEQSKFIIEKQIADFLVKIKANKNNDIQQWDNITSKHIIRLDSLKKYVHYLN